MLNEGEKCRKSTYSIKKIMPYPRGARLYLCFIKLTLQSQKDF